MLRRIFITGILLATGAFAQLSSFPTASYFREVFRPQDTKVELAPPAKLGDYVKEGADCARDVVREAAEKAAAAAPKLPIESLDVSLSDAPVVETKTTTASRCLVLSLQDYLSLVMANQTSVQTAYLSVESSKNSLTSAYARFDPVLTLNFSPYQNYSYRTDSGKAGSTFWSGSASLSQPLQTGQTLSFSGNGNRTTSSGLLTSSSGLSFGITQPSYLGVTVKPEVAITIRFQTRDTK